MFAHKCVRVYLASDRSASNRSIDQLRIDRSISFRSIDRSIDRSIVRANEQRARSRDERRRAAVRRREMRRAAVAGVRGCRGDPPPLSVAPPTHTHLHSKRVPSRLRSLRPGDGRALPARQVVRARRRRLLRRRRLARAAAVGVRPVRAPPRRCLASYDGYSKGCVGVDPCERCGCGARPRTTVALASVVKQAGAFLPPNVVVLMSIGTSRGASRSVPSRRGPGGSSAARASSTRAAWPRSSRPRYSREVGCWGGGEWEGVSESHS